MLNPRLTFKIYIASAWYDLVLSAAFALPFAAGLLWTGLLTPLHQFFGFAPLPPLDAHGMLFANFFGSVVLIWSVVRLRWRDMRMGFFDGIARGLFSVAMLNALMSGGSPILGPLIVFEIAFCIAQLAGTYPHSSRKVAVSPIEGEAPRRGLMDS